MGLSKFFMLLFFVQVSTPFGLKITYDDVRRFIAWEGCYELELKGGKHVWVPMAFTIIKEK